MSVGSFSNDDGDGNENVKKAIGLLSKTTSLHVHHTFLYISLPLLHATTTWKCLVSRFMEDVKQATTNFSFSFLNCLRLPRLLTTNTRQLEILVTTLQAY